MAFLLDWLALPVRGGQKMVLWLAGKLLEEAEREPLDEDRVRGELLELQERYDAGELGEEEYDRQESALLDRLNAVREAKAQESSRTGSAAEKPPHRSS